MRCDAQFFVWSKSTLELFPGMTARGRFLEQNQPSLRNAWLNWRRLSVMHYTQACSCDLDLPANER